MHLPDPSTLEMLAVAWPVYQLARAAGGGLLRLLRPGRGRHRQPRRQRNDT
jgi:hypothetical protein